jgi:1-deoxy-D-xylulose-5-phosphate reductoisomerase
MGPKITIDSATMMNKALEIIEARWLFDVPVDRIDVLIHPESVVHSMVEFVDGSVIAQMGTPDMCLPIQYAFTYPKRMKGITEHLKLENLKTLSFYEPNMEVFRSLSLAYEVAEKGGSAPVVFNAANESAVELFLNEEIKFSEIVQLVEKTLEGHKLKKNLDIEQLLEIDKWSRKQVHQLKY